MRSLLSAVVVLALFAGLFLAAVTPAADPAAVPAAGAGPMVAHNVFFSLKDNSEAAKKAIVDDCHKLLPATPGVVFYAAGTLAPDFQRDVNDRDFDVALHCVFKDKTALEQYLAAPKHVELVEKYRPNWKKVRVFDSYVSGAPK